MALVVQSQPPISVQALVQNGLEEVPSRFLQRSLDSRVSAPFEESLPIIDHGKLLRNDPSELAKLGAACAEWGFFQVVNHDIPISLLERVRKAARQFFHLSHEEKLEFAIKPGSCEGYGRHFLASDVLDWVDLLYHQLLPISTRNLSSWPTKPESYRTVLHEYSNEVHGLAKCLLGKISETLGLESDFLEKKFGECIYQTIRVNHYPPCPQPDRVMGLSPHSDPGGITILLQDDVEGLQVRKNGKWVQVQADPEAFVVNLADQIEIITNGLYKSVEHRAVVKTESKERISLAMFHSPLPDTLVSPAANFVNPRQPSRYTSMTFGQYRSSFLNKELRGKNHVKSMLVEKEQD
ncbi:2-oxoglutarate-iron(II)-dependent oxygenase [Selaginella moellendorffii]|uniref:2-oxoglutarate-iron(II)-dependent oxygenase n=1 Tax=Selaginella moellendorffii TaxID=88036 RepID=D8SQ26_SELML|nr:probable 2-oxoglutarate-dependent dioxygenase ANS [Selaginella moellendorffii]EFJ13589.1 2-oxoglutarate-iron(II)-dependent oxygenase [Selaginella moellendorffii]|eukprot:XP_024515054.1 probable 2-oxoglutarate-dependent dioxygenase ANS [Selaginella moellendorffii]